MRRLSVVPTLAVLAALLAICLVPAFPAMAADPLGTVARVQGRAEAVRDSGPIPLAKGDVLQAGDVLRTGPDSRLRADLSDGSVLTLGGAAELQLNDVVVPRDDSGDGPFMDLLGGTFRLVAAKLADPGAVTRTIRTPVATIGIRGTDVWGGPLSGALDVLLLDGAVAVTNGAGTTLLTPGQGTVVPTRGAAPGPATVWPETKVSRAVATVAFADDQIK